MIRTIEVASPLPWYLRWLAPAWIELDVDMDIDWDWCNDGIGSYEFWGQRCYDAGTNYIEVNDVDSHVYDPADIPWLWKLFPKKLASLIYNACYEDSQTDSMREDIEDSYDPTPEF